MPLSEQLTVERPIVGDPRLVNLRCIVIVPAYNEAEAIASVIAEIHAVEPGFEIVVVDDGSGDLTTKIAERAGARVVRLPYNLGIGGAVQTGYQFARDHGFDVAVQVDGDGQHDPSQIPLLLEPLLAGRADMAVGTRFAGTGSYKVPFFRRVGITIFAGVVSLIIRKRVTDTTSGFRAVNRRGIRLFASDYPHDYPEVEASVLVCKHKLQMVEVPVSMRERSGGTSSITILRSMYYMIKVLLALFIGLFRRYPPDRSSEEEA